MMRDQERGECHCSSALASDDEADGARRPIGARRRRRRAGVFTVQAIGLVCAMILGPGELSADETAREGYGRVKEGNRLLAEAKYEAALKAYEEAAAQLPESPEVAYNRGLALYRLGKYDESQKAFQDALKPSHPELEARTKYNLGRAAHAEALARREKPEEAINELSKAISFYQEAQGLDPNDVDAGKNLELAQRLRTFLEQKLEQGKKKQSPQSRPSSQPEEKQEQQPTSQPRASSQPTSQPRQEQSTSQPDQGNRDQQKDADSKDSTDSRSEESGEEEKDEEKQSDGSKEKESRKPGEPSTGSKEGANDQDAHEPGQAASEEPEQEDRRMKEEDVRPMLQEARDAEKARRESRRARLMRLRGRTAVKKDW